MVDSKMSLQLVLFVAFTRFLITCQGRYHHHHIKHKHHTHSHPPLAQISTPPSSPSLSPSPSPSPSPSQSPSPSPFPSQSPSPSPSPSQSPSPSPSPSESPSPSPSPYGDHPTNNGTSPNNSSSNVFDVRSFGAVGDGVTDDTQAFKTAWDTVCQLESAVGVLFVPAGYSFMIQSTIFTGPCQSSFVFHVDGTLMPPDGPEEWPKNNSKHQWLVFYKVNDLSLQGGGVIDGRGGKWWDLPCKPHKGVNGSTLPGPCDSPIAIRFFMSSNLTVKDIRIRDSPQFHFRFDGCSNVHIESIHITAPALSPNTDGIHIENTNNVQIYDSVISNGDDCVSIGSGCYDVDIKNITCGPGHGISIGSLGNHNSRACVSNITVRDSLIKNADNGVRIKTWQGGHGAVSGITFTNIHMDNVRNPIIIDQFYCLAKTCSNQTSAVFVSDIVYTQIKGTYDVRSPPIHFACSDSVPCANITLSDVELLPAQGEILLDPYCLNAYGDSHTVTIPPVWCLQDDFPGSLQENALDYC